MVAAVKCVYLMLHARAQEDAIVCLNNAEEKFKALKGFWHDEFTSQTAAGRRWAEFITTAMQCSSTDKDVYDAAAGKLQQGLAEMLRARLPAPVLPGGLTNLYSQEVCT